MEVDFSRRRITMRKVLNSLDRFVKEFTSLLNEAGIKYVIVSGYVPILFGRSRTSEDVDVIAEKVGLSVFKKLWEKTSGTFECINEDNPEDAYRRHLLMGNAIRFARKGTFIPNIELKFPKNELDEWALEKRKETSVNSGIIFISPLELQIPFKLFLGSEKDIEDARYLYRIFKDNLKLPLLREFTRKLEVDELFNKYLGEK